MAVDLVALSTFLSYVLRHKPDSIGVSLDAQGWAIIDDLLARAVSVQVSVSRDDLLGILDKSDNKRFAISSDGKRIRALHGHSVLVDLNLVATEPPPVLFHGTATRSLQCIRREGLTPQRRGYVHLTADCATAMHVGRRHGTAVVLAIDAQRMCQNGSRFYSLENGVWLTREVPPAFLHLPADDNLFASASTWPEQPILDTM